jgi:hypothetical protein
LLGLFVTTALNRSTIPASLKSQVNLDNVNFVTNAHLAEVLGRTTATPEEVEQAAEINRSARLQALKASFVILAGIALLAIFPASALPKRVPGDVSPAAVTDHDAAGEFAATSPA